MIIETDLTYEFVTKAYEEYCRLQGKKLVPIWFYKEVMESIKVIDERYYEIDIEDAMNKFVYSYQELKNHVYSCCRCDNDMPIRGRSLEDSQQYLSSKWGHAECINNN